MEDWYHAHDLKLEPECWEGLADRVEAGTDVLLELLAGNNVRGTFFILGWVAGRHPQLVKRIAGAGHEIGSHGSRHRLIYRQTREEFRRDLLSSRQILEDLTGKEINIYRAPSWSISAGTLWALEILEEEGFRCDSSIQPFRTPLSGLPGAPVAPYHPVINGRKLNLVEFPPTVLPVGRCRLPFAGGFYLRVLPYRLIRWALTRVNRQNPGLVYVHPWETDLAQPRLKVPLLTGITHYFNLSTTVLKLTALCRDFSFAPLGEVIKGVCYPSCPLGQGDRDDKERLLEA